MKQGEKEADLDEVETRVDELEEGEIREYPLDGTTRSASMKRKARS